MRGLAGGGAINITGGAGNTLLASGTPGAVVISGGTAGITGQSGASVSVTASSAFAGATNANGGNLVNQLLLGQSLPGYLNTLPGGISPDVTQHIVDQSLKDLYPQFQSSGILDSGVAASIAGRTSGDIRASAEQFNIQNLQQLLNLAVGGQAQVQQPMLNTTGQLGQRLSGLRSSTSTVTAMNPFLKSFQQSLGQNLGNTGSEALKWAFA